MDVIVGRQPILDRNSKTVAYELLFRSGTENRFDGSDGGLATTTVIANAFLNIGCNRVLGKKRGFINFTRDLLLSDDVLMLPKDRVVIEILEDIEPDAEVVEACRKLKTLGYQIALDDVSVSATASPLIRHAQYAKIEWLGVGSDERRHLCQFFQKQRLRLLAEKVETKSDFEAAMALGCEFFQGYYFARPEILTSRRIPSAQLTCLRLITETQRRELDFARLETIVKGDIGLTQKLLYLANSAVYTAHHHVKTLREAFVALGENNIRRWVALAAMPGLAIGKPAELATMSRTRARFCELIAEQSSLRQWGSACFLIGLLSLLDVLLGRPLGELIAELGLEDRIANAILGTSQADNPLGSVLELAVALERSDVAAEERLSAALGLPPGVAGGLQLEAMTWADRIAV